MHCIFYERYATWQRSIRAADLAKPSTSFAHAGSTVACSGVLVGNQTSPLTCLSPLSSAEAVLGAGDVLTSWWVLSVLLHSSFRFSSSLSLCLCSRRSVAEDGVPPRTFSMDGLRPSPSVSPPGKPVLPELWGSRPVLSPLLYSAQRFRMVSRRCRSCGRTQSQKKKRDIKSSFDWPVLSLTSLTDCLHAAREFRSKTHHYNFTCTATKTTNKSQRL